MGVHAVADTYSAVRPTAMGIAYFLTKDVDEGDIRLSLDERVCGGRQ